MTNDRHAIDRRDLASRGTFAPIRMIQGGGKSRIFLRRLIHDRMEDESRPRLSRKNGASCLSERFLSR